MRKALTQTAKGSYREIWKTACFQYDKKAKLKTERPDSNERATANGPIDPRGAGEAIGHYLLPT